jgi:hypothetical protein
MVPGAKVTSMNSCNQHLNKPQISCPECFSDADLQAAIDKLQATKIPSGPSGTKKKPRRLDDPAKPKKPSWKDSLDI